MSRPHRRYSTEFKLQLVQSYLDGEGSVKAIASRHGDWSFAPLIWIDKDGLVSGVDTSEEPSGEGS